MKKQPKDEEAINALDRQFKGLGMEEMTPLKKGSDEFEHLKKYLHDTKGSTHHLNYQVAEILRIERQGEHERYAKTKVNISASRHLEFPSFTKTTTNCPSLVQGWPGHSPALAWLSGYELWWNSQSRSANCAS